LQAFFYACYRDSPAASGLQDGGECPSGCRVVAGSITAVLHLGQCAANSHFRLSPVCVAQATFMMWSLWDSNPVYAENFIAKTQHIGFDIRL
jgi:hypothetical protein